MAKFTVSRKTWFRGQGSQKSMLLLLDGNRCCIGFVANQCGVSNEAVSQRGDIKCMSSFNEKKKFPLWMRNSNSFEDIYEAYTTNDDEEISDEEREAKLKEIFLRNGDELEFVD